MEQEFMDAIDAVMEPLYPGYRRYFGWWPVKGTWKPAEGSHPFKGTVGEIEVSDEVHLEFAVKEKDLKAVLSVIVDLHPYEEPSIDIIPLVSWKSVLGSRSSIYDP